MYARLNFKKEFEITYNNIIYTKIEIHKLYAPKNVKTYKGRLGARTGAVDNEIHTDLDYNG